MTMSKLTIEETEAIDKLLKLLEDCNDSSTKTTVSAAVAKLAERGSTATIDKVLRSMPMNQLAELLAPDAEWHESVFMTLTSLTEGGKSRAVEMMITSGIDKKILILFETGF